MSVKQWVNHVVTINFRVFQQLEDSFQKYGGGGSERNDLHFIPPYILF
jgi:hypothetical protein